MKFRVLLTTAAMPQHRPHVIEANSAIEAVAIVAVGIVKKQQETGLDVGFRAPLGIAIDEVE